MKKLSLRSLFPEEDGMFFHNKVFRCLHSLMRENSLTICLGISEARDTLYFYGDLAQLNKFVDAPEIQTMLYRKIYAETFEECTSAEPLLSRVNYFDPKSKAKKKLAYIKSNFGKANKRETNGRETLSDFVQHYEKKQEKQQKLTKDTVYFIANKGDRKLSLYAHRFLGDPTLVKPNTYGFVNRVHLNGN